MKHSSLSFVTSLMRAAVLCKVLTALAVPAVWASDMTLAKGLAAAQGGEVTAAMEAARQTDDETERKLIQWELLQQKSVTAPFDSYTEFLSSVSNWPLRATIQLRAEEIFPDTLPDSEVTAWFADRKPITTRGLLRYGRAMMATGRGSEAVTVVRDYFINRDFSTDGAAQIMAAFPGMLNAKDIAARVDKLIWEEKLTEARSLLAYLPESERAVPATRLALLQQEPRAEKLLDALSENQRNDPNVAFARAHWRRELGFDNSAAVILARITAPSSREEEVATERAILARRFFGEGDFGAAYAVLAGQPAVQGQNATQNIWHAGWLALRFKQDTVAAARHFQQFYDLVQMPVSKTRGAYWLGRTAAAAGQSDVARQWYQQAATDGTTFYGQLATQELRQSLRLPARETATQDPILQDERLKAARLLATVGNTDDARTFFRSVLGDAKERPQFVALADWASRQNQPQWAVFSSKAAQRAGFMGLALGYPILPKTLQAEFDSRADRALIHALIRQESEFDRNAVSRSGALGLMQLMPKTAAYVAKKMDVSHSTGALTADPAHNVALGSRYISDRLADFEHPALAIAAYNAGQGRVRQWVKQYGDPRSPNVNWIDWVESIPTYETRNYVQRVLENQNIYAALLSD